MLWSYGANHRRSPLALRDCIAIFDNELLLFSLAGPAAGWSTPLKALANGLASSMWPARVSFFLRADSVSVVFVEFVSFS